MPLEALQLALLQNPSLWAPVQTRNDQDLDPPRRMALRSRRPRPLPLKLREPLGPTLCVSTLSTRKRKRAPRSWKATPPVFRLAARAARHVLIALHFRTEPRHATTKLELDPTTQLRRNHPESLTEALSELGLASWCEARTNLIKFIKLIKLFELIKLIKFIKLFKFIKFIKLFELFEISWGAGSPPRSRGAFGSRSRTLFDPATKRWRHLARVWAEAWRLGTATLSRFALARISVNRISVSRVSVSRVSVSRFSIKPALASHGDSTSFDRDHRTPRTGGFRSNDDGSIRKLDALSAILTNRRFA